VLLSGEGSNTTPILVAHNGRRFDFPFLISHMAAAGLAMPSGWLALDSLELARQFLPSLKHHKLGRPPVPSSICSHCYFRMHMPSHLITYSTFMTSVVFDK
jgi:DNA polymerase III alpha subunit (gram-positive type)